jgi:hypothetical protein
MSARERIHQLTICALKIKPKAMIAIVTSRGDRAVVRRRRQAPPTLTPRRELSPCNDDVATASRELRHESLIPKGA